MLDAAYIALTSTIGLHFDDPTANPRTGSRHAGMAMAPDAVESKPQPWPRQHAHLENTCSDAARTGLSAIRPVNHIAEMIGGQAAARLLCAGPSRIRFSRPGLGKPMPVAARHPASRKQPPPAPRFHPPGAGQADAGRVPVARIGQATTGDTAAANYAQEVRRTAAPGRDAERPSARRARRPHRKTMERPAARTGAGLRPGFAAPPRRSE